MQSSDLIQIGKPDQIDRLIAACITLGLPWRAELLRSVRACELNLIEPRRDGIVSKRMLKTSIRPTVVVLGDDDYAATGPTGWATVPNLLRWARGALVHATGGDVASYQTAIGMALAAQRFVLVETDSAHAQEWGDALIRHHIPVVGLLPANGVHPVSPPRGSMQ